MCTYTQTSCSVAVLTSVREELWKVFPSFGVDYLMVTSMRSMAWLSGCFVDGLGLLVVEVRGSALPVVLSFSCVSNMVIRY